jgi:predicted RNase H-like nuclease (RuvC/YqgF family)
MNQHLFHVAPYLTAVINSIMLQMERKPNISYVDPAICALINSLKDELEAMCKLVERQRDELEAVKFTPHSSVGLRLMAKCSALRAENEELGRLLQQGTIEKYQLENNLQRKLITELKSALNGTALFIFNCIENVHLIIGIFRIQRICRFFGPRD